MNLRGFTRAEFPKRVKAALPSLAELRAILAYDEAAGTFRWLVSRPNTSMGAIAGHLGPKGYWVIKINGAQHRAHRLAWLYMTGRGPEGQIDHINGERADNRWMNLRLATASQNTANSRRRNDNRSGYKGVSRVSRSTKWAARITLNGRTKNLGCFNNPEDAHAAYMQEAARLFGSFQHSGER